MNGFRDREDAGRRLAAELRAYAAERPIVLALPRGGVPVAYEVARALGAELDVWIVRKLGVPWYPELGVGAVAEGNYVHLTDEVLRRVGISRDELGALIATKQHEVAQRVRRFRGERSAPGLRDRTVILVDDGIATGGTVRAAIRSIRAQAPKRVVLAVPVAAADTIEALSAEVDRVVCLLSPTDLYAIGLWYQDFRQISDDEVAQLLDRARDERLATAERARAEANPSELDRARDERLETEASRSEVDRAANERAATAERPRADASRSERAEKESTTHVR